jgi:hypothetical protein
MFSAFKAIVEKQFGHQFQNLKKDNSDEYVNTKFNTHCTA